MLSIILTLFQYPGRENVKSALRICKITSPKGKRKKCKKKQSETGKKDYLINKKNRNKRLKQYLTRITYKD